MATVVDLPSYPTAAADAGEARWRQMLRKAFSNGVWNGQGGNLLVTATGTSGMTVNVGTGEGIVDGIWFEQTLTPSIDIAPAPGGSLSRIDLVVIRLNTASPLKAQIRVLTGTPAQSPTRPTIVAQTDIALAQIAISPTTTALSNAVITDLRPFAQVASVAYQLPSFLNGWQTDSSAGRAFTNYWRDGSGMIHLDGRIFNGTLAAPAFILPVGYRPLTQQIHISFCEAANNARGTCTVVVETDGNVKIFPNPNSTPSGTVYYHLQNVHFKAAN